MDSTIVGPRVDMAMGQITNTFHTISKSHRLAWKRNFTLRHAFRITAVKLLQSVVAPAQIAIILRAT